MGRAEPAPACKRAGLLGCRRARVGVCQSTKDEGDATDCCRKRQLAMALAMGTAGGGGGTMAVMVQLVGPSWGPRQRYTSAAVLRRHDAARRVQAEFERTGGSCADCKAVDVRQALAARGVAFRRSAEHAELVALVERSMPVVAAAEQAELDSIECNATVDWVAADVRAAVAYKCAVAPSRLRGLYVQDALAPEGATFGELAVVDGASLQLVIASVADEPAQMRRVESAKDAVVRQRARDAKKQHVTSVRALLAAGEKHQHRGEWRLAADCYSQAIIATRAGDVTLQSMLSNRGLCHSRLGEHRNAWMDHNRALDLAPSMHIRTLHYQNRGTCALRLGMLEEAWDDFEMAARHASTASVVSAATKQLQRLKQPLQTACEGQFKWLRQYYPAVGLSSHCESVEAFHALCRETREALGRHMNSLSQRHDRCALVHKCALESICKEKDMEPSPITEGARAEFERILKQEARALLMDHAEEEGTLDRTDTHEGTTPVSTQRSVGCVSGPNIEQWAEVQVETLHESEIREAIENDEKRIASHSTMVGNVANGFVLMRERKAVYEINHRSSGSDHRSRSAGVRSQKTARTKQRRPATAPASNTRPSQSSADAAGLHSTVSAERSTVATQKIRMVGQDTSLESMFRNLLPITATDSGSETESESESESESEAALTNDGSNGGADGRSHITSRIDARPCTALSQKQKQKLLAQQRSIARLSDLRGTKAAPAAKVIVGGITMETPAQQQATERKMKRFRRETRRRLLRTEMCPGRNTPCAGQLYDTVPYRDKTRQHAGPPGNLYRGRAARVAQMALKPDTASMESLLGDWTKAEAAAHFFSTNGSVPGNVSSQQQHDRQRPQSASSSFAAPGHCVSKDKSSASGNQSSTRDQAPAWSAWSAWQEEMSYRRCEEEKSVGACSGGTFAGLAMRGCTVGMLTVPRFLQV
eukprot:COSAG02_NODE_320_length_24784_cov_30.538708_6_plen_937_part_00